MEEAMNGICFKIFIFAAVFLTKNAFTQQLVQMESEKIYVLPENIQFSGSDIFVCINENWVQTSVLFSDIQGMYVPINSVIGEWQCWRCNAMNWAWSLACWNCKAPR